MDFEVHDKVPVIGAGAFAAVFQVRHKQTRQKFACKVMQRHHFEVRGMGAQIPAEIRALQLAATVEESRSRIVRLYGVCEEAGCIFLLLELCCFGTLQHELLTQAHGCISEARATACMQQLLEGLQDMHALGVLHRDIKLENLLVTVGGALKIVDFGWTADVADSPSNLAGTFHTMAPEILLGQPQTPAVDLWSAGVVLFQIVTGKPLLSAEIGPGATQLTHCNPNGATEIRKRLLLDEIHASCPPPESSRPPHVSKACWNLLQCLLDPNPAQRISAREALQHHWFLGPSPQRPIDPTGMRSTGVASTGSGEASVPPPKEEDELIQSGEMLSMKSADESARSEETPSTVCSEDCSLEEAILVSEHASEIHEQPGEVPFNALVERLGELRRAIAEGREPKSTLSSRTCNSSGMVTPVGKFHGSHSRNSSTDKTASTMASPLSSSRDSLEKETSTTFSWAPVVNAQIIA